MQKGGQAHQKLDGHGSRHEAFGRRGWGQAVAAPAAVGIRLRRSGREPDRPR
jgi:hypothetical protein